MTKKKTDAWVAWPLEIGRTVRFVTVCVLIYAIVHRITWMVVRLTDKPPLLEFAELVTGLFVVGSGAAYWRLRVQWHRAKIERAAQPPPIQLPPPEPRPEEGGPT